MTQIKNNFTYIIIAILIVIILLQRSCNKSSVISKPASITTQTDTVWKIKTDTFIKKVNVKSISYQLPPNEPAYQTSENIDSCKARFNYLLKQHIARRIYSDTITLDSIGTITIIDTIWMNKLKKRTYINNYKIPFVTKTVTITKTADPVRQLYIGGNLFGNQSIIQVVSPGLLYKTKKDHMYQINVGIDSNGSLVYGAGMYWKIKLK